MHPSRLKVWSQSKLVLEVGAEGGTLAFVRQQNQQGTWEYRWLRDETTIADLLPKSDSGNRDDLFEICQHGRVRMRLVRSWSVPMFFACTR